MKVALTRETHVKFGKQVSLLIVAFKNAQEFHEALSIYYKGINFCGN